MTTDPRLEALVEKAGIIHTDGMRNKLRALLAEAMEAGAWVTCPECGGSGDVIDNLQSCRTCDGTGRIRRELAGVLWALAPSDGAWSTSDAGTIEEAREKWGAKPEEAKP